MHDLLFEISGLGDEYLRQYALSQAGFADYDRDMNSRIHLSS
jgi:hypothetical protein